MTELEKHIQNYFGVNESALAKISSFFHTVSFKKGDSFLKTGQYADRMGFIQSGIMREYIYTNNKEITKWIATTGSFVVDLSAFMFRQPARWNIQAITECELYVISQKDYLQIQKVVSQWDSMEKLFIAKCFAVLEERVVMHLSMSAEERYQLLFDYNSDLFNQVPLQYLASMLGMTPETFSRIRKKAMNSSS